MRPLIKTLVYFAGIGIFGFLLGRVMPKRWFSGEKFPFRTFGWEKQGSIYNALGVRRWKDKVPDMSRILPKLMPSRKLRGGMSAAEVLSLIRETCVAEWIHGLLCILGFGSVLIWRGVWGFVAAGVYALGNLPDIVIQRYNRPKLMRIYKRLQSKESAHEKCDDFELQHGAGA